MRETYRPDGTIIYNGERYHFAFKSSYMGTVDYSVSGPEGAYTASWRYGLTATERSQLNYTPEEITREVEAAIGLLVRCTCDDAGEVPADTVAAFNAWRDREHARQLEIMISQPERYGPESELRREFTAYAPVAAGRWIRGTGWIRVEAAPMAA